MPPSRALSALGRNGWSSQFVAQCRARSWQESTRSFSGATAAHPRMRPILRNQSPLHHNSPLVRHASWFSRSQPEPQPQTAVPSAFVPDDASPSTALHSPAEPVLSDTLDITSTLTEKAPFTNDYIGFLKEDYGIDFGWGTSSIIKYLFEHVHVYSGLPLAGSIIATAALVRFFMIFATMSSVENSAKMAALLPVTKPLVERHREAKETGDRATMQRCQVELREVYRSQGLAAWKFGLGLLNIPLGFGCWRTFRNMADAPVAGMSTGGIAWFSNLTVPDPTFILPLATAALQHYSAKSASENQTFTLSDQQQKMQKFMVWGLPVLGVLVISWAPAAVQLHFATTSFFALVTNVALASNTVRSWMRMTARPKDLGTKSPKSPYKGTINVAGRSTPTGASAARASPKPGSAGSSKQDVFGKMTGGAARLFTSARKSVKSVMPDAQSRVKKYQTKAQKSKAKEYEMRRRREIEEERVDWERSQDSQPSSRNRRRG